MDWSLHASVLKKQMIVYTFLGTLLMYLGVYMHSCSFVCAKMYLILRNVIINFDAHSYGLTHMLYLLAFKKYNTIFMFLKV